jgi:hypothetical protein
MRLAFVAVLSLLASGAAAAQAPTPARLLDGFDNAADWQALHTDDVSASVREDTGMNGKALCLDFDFNGVSGSASLKRRLPIDYPANFALSFDVHGQMPANTLQLKLIDSTGDNVWWYQLADFQPVNAWQHIEARRRKIDFAWGPTKDRTLRQTTDVELMVYAGRAGRGNLCFDNFLLTPLPPEATTFPTPVATASSTVTGYPAPAPLDRSLGPAWRNDPAAGNNPSYTVDLGTTREFGGVVLTWEHGRAPTHYTVQLSDDGHEWQTARTVTDGDGGEDAIFLPESSAQFLRVAIDAPSPKQYGLASLQLKSPAWGATPNAFFQAQAKEVRRGFYPRGFSGEQSYWTVLGVDGGAQDSALISEDGAVEVDRGGFSIEPMLLTAHGVKTWADTHPVQSLEDGYLPMPSVFWPGDVSLQTTAFGMHQDGDAVTALRYTLQNNSDEPQEVTLALLARPFQVNPPTQFLNSPGGTSPIHDFTWDGRSLAVNGDRWVLPLQSTDAFVASSYDAGNLAERLAGGERPEASRVHDDFGFMQGALLYKVSLLPGASRTIGLLVNPNHPTRVATNDAAGWLDMQADAVADEWREKLNRVNLTVPSAAQPIVDTVRSALAQILMSRNGPALQPGTRSYARTWVRDGAMMADGLLRMGHEDEARDFVQWYAPHQFANGKVPCCVDQRGSDPVPENDSQGELIFSIAELYRYTRDKAMLAALWPNIAHAVNYMDELRASESTARNRTAGHRAFFGMMPASISHEGYSAKPMHSYWDDFWAMKGYDDAVAMADVLEQTAALPALTSSRDSFRADLHASILAATTQHAIDFLPGAAELGDFDATSSTIAMSPEGEFARLPRALVVNTFERYWRAFVERRDGKTAWEDYTPYEVRNIAAFIRLGWRDRVMALNEFFFADRRPAAWNQWAEVVGRDVRKPRFVGDMPHAWIASDYVRSALDMFAYERDADHAIVLAAGVAPAWLDNEGIAVDSLRTPFGQLAYSLRKERRQLVLTVADSIQLPPGGIVLPWPYPGTPGVTLVNGKRATWTNGELVLRTVPATVKVTL